jgi:glycerol-3-phosphate cytidylyltransferase/D-beta-D-heptose 7-phosphate kinase/D-beta-D-heptose 1-phosphate adenosyltransferase
MTREPGRPQVVAVVSGYFNPLHVGHLRLMEAARAGADRLVVIVNNDVQQRAKKGRAITVEQDRLRLVRALAVVDEAFLATDTGPGVGDSLRALRERCPGATIVFCNGGDRRRADDVPEHERRVCAEAGIEMRFGVGGTDKADSSSRIIEALGRRADEPLPGTG